MSLPDYRFYVIEIDNRNGPDKYICIPATWIHKRDTGRTQYVVIKYPNGDKHSIKRFAMKEVKYDERWEFLFGYLKYGTDNYTDGEDYLNLLNSQEIRRQNYDETSRGGGPSEYHRNTQHEGLQTHSDRTQQVSGSKQSTMTQPRQAVQSSKIKDRLHSCINLNRENESRQTHSDRTEQASGNPQKTMTQPSQDVQSLREREELFSENQSNTRHEVPKTHSDRTEEAASSTQSSLAQSMQAEKSPNRIEELSSLLDKIRVSELKGPQTPVVSSNHQSNDPIATQNAYVSSCEGEVMNVSKKRYSGFTLPAEYDPNDSRWTLKHKEPNPNLEELIPCSALYVDSKALERSKLLADNSKQLLICLLPEVFNNTALSSCTRTGTGNRPHLDKDALKILLKYIIYYAENSGWPVVSIGELEKTIPNILKKFRPRQSNNNSLSSP